MKKRVYGILMLSIFCFCNNSPTSSNSDPQQQHVYNITIDPAIVSVQDTISQGYFLHRYTYSLELNEPIDKNWVILSWGWNSYENIWKEEPVYLDYNGFQPFEQLISAMWSSSDPKRIYYRYSAYDTNYVKTAFYNSKHKLLLIRPSTE